MLAISDVKQSTDLLIAGEGVLIGKVTALIAVAAATQAALVALQATTDPTTGAQLQAILDEQTAALAALQTEGVAVDAAAVADAAPVVAAPVVVAPIDSAPSAPEALAI